MHELSSRSRNHFVHHHFSNYINHSKQYCLNLHSLFPRGDRPLKMTFEGQLNALIFLHLEEHVSARHLIRNLKEDDFARENIAPENGISRSSFSEAINNRGLEQLKYVFEKLSIEASNILPDQHADLGNLVAFDGSLTLQRHLFFGRFDLKGLQL